jgi:hypothetical protein
VYIRQTDVSYSAICSADQGLKHVCSLRESWFLFLLALHSGYALLSNPRSPFVWLRLQERLDTYLMSGSFRHKLTHPLAFLLSLPGASRMSSEETDSSRLSRNSCFDTPPRFLEEQAPSASLVCSHPTESHGIGIDNTQPFIETMLPRPGHVHIHKSSPNVSGYFASVQPLNCSPNTSSGTALTNTAVSENTSPEDQKDAAASSPPQDAAPQRFRRRIWSAFFLYFVGL